MLKRTMRSRTLNEEGIGAGEVDQAIDGLLNGGLKVADLDSRLCKSVQSQLIQMRKDIILAQKEQLAAKINEILGELARGPPRFNLTDAGDPLESRESKLAKLRPLTTTVASRTILHSKTIDGVESRGRQEAIPILKTKLEREESRERYAKSGVVAGAIDRAVQYAADSRRLGPRLLKVEALRQKLDAAREKYLDARQKAYESRQRNEEIQKEAERKLTERLDQDMLDYGSHVPTSLPLEFSKFSARTLDAREREANAAGCRRWDDAEAFKSEALGREKVELLAQTERFTRSYKLQRSRMLNLQDKKQHGFADNWARKKEESERQLQKELAELKATVEHYEAKLAEVEGIAFGELSRIHTHAHE